MAVVPASSASSRVRQLHIPAHSDRASKCSDSFTIDIQAGHLLTVCGCGVAVGGDKRVSRAYHHVLPNCGGLQILLLVIPSTSLEKLHSQRPSVEALRIIKRHAFDTAPKGLRNEVLMLQLQVQQMVEVSVDSKAVSNMWCKCSSTK